ncbi:glutamate-1-semialdehyde 2,1-aminomutase [Hydrogenispora ethanolica]|uniref:Glutamate-1-semialdehyde 2,1-aminomutase n=1 Tax=Hydrogenispora ethanolica TaxID=1082276 RepID=A0A4R1S4A5_HYDET|nr:glutamate-1-semialdehyde 2,1-aminomutase [Hydrogenispora ethanolica]TCL74083.1 glutamate-1-semialdehyde 2,1-aminomutase [Hydrogenispora ethanolica]
MAEPIRPERSGQLFERALRSIPGGVNSPVRAFRSVGGTPRFIAKGSGAYLWDVDGRRYLDFVGSWGPLILGHARPEILAALERVMADGTSFGAPTEAEVVLAETILAAFPGMDQVRLVNSGTEATMSAIRLARAHTGRSLLVKFAGCYHGHSDSLLVKAGSGAATLGVPDSLGVTAAVSGQTLILPFNDGEALAEAFAARGGEIAAVIVEPFPGNMGLVLPHPGYLEELRRLTAASGAALIFDEVITGFRVAYGGVQTLYGIEPDLTCLGKIIGGGLPVGAYGGKRELMALLAPEGPVYQAGTLSGNPLAVAAGLTTLRLLQELQPYPELAQRTAAFAAELRALFERAGIPATVNQAESLFTVFFNPGPVVDYESASRSDRERYARFFHAMLERGFYFSPGQFETCFLSTAHGSADLEQALSAVRDALPELGGR